jgi:hypothetical protein
MIAIGVVLANNKRCRRLLAYPILNGEESDLLSQIHIG